MANIVKLTGCKEVSHDIYAYFTCDAEKALKALELEIPCTGAIALEHTTSTLMIREKLSVST